jgi:hypothetical protein
MGRCDSTWISINFTLDQMGDWLTAPFEGPVLVISGLSEVEVSHSVLVMLMKWFSLPRLETRTKESKICASKKVVNLYA